MENGELYDLFLTLIRQEMGVNSNDCIKDITISEQQAKELIKFSRKHSLDHLIISALLKNGQLNRQSDFAKKAEQSLFRTVINDERRNYDIENISKLFEKNGIDFIFLKGSVIRNFYPERWMRSSCDIDVLVRDIGSAERILAENGYIKLQEGSHDMLFVSAAKIGIELHFRLIETDDRVSAVLSHVWDSAIPEADTNHSYLMSNEMFRFYHIAHMSKHFLFGGCGIRFFIDLWLLMQNQEINSREYEQMLAETGLLAFAQHCESLARIWMAGEEPQGELAEMAEFILNGGVFGSTGNAVLLNRTRHSNKFTFIMYRIFMPYSLMRLKYPILEKRPVLLPFYWVKRWFEFLSADEKRKNAKSETHFSDEASGESIYRMKALLKTLDMHKKQIGRS